MDSKSSTPSYEELKQENETLKAHINRLENAIRDFSESVKPIQLKKLVNSDSMKISQKKKFAFNFSLKTLFCGVFLISLLIFSYQKYQQHRQQKQKFEIYQKQMNTLQIILDKGLKEKYSLIEIENMTKLNLGDSSFKESYYQYLKYIPNLSELSLKNQWIKDPVLVHLQELNKISKLDLSDTWITDKGISFLLPLKKQLTFLSLAGTSITDLSIEQLKKFTNLSELNLQGSKISPTGVKKLKLALPKCKINI